VVFYNGIADRPDKEVLSLSAAFEEKSVEDLVGSLELKVPVYNINKHKNSELFARSEKLRQYAEFVDKLRELQNVYNDYASAVKETVEYCIEHDILAGFLKEHGGEIVSILFAEYNEELAMRVHDEELVEDTLEDVAISLLKSGMPIELVAKHTRLSEEITARLKKELAGDIHV
jgi:hypothetical protein